MANDCMYSLIVQFMPDTTDLESEDTGEQTTPCCLFYEGNFFIITNNFQVMGHLFFASTFYIARNA